MSEPTRRRRRTPGVRSATIGDVAQAAGVSTATVSRVLAGNYPVAEDTRRRVEEAVESLSYSASGYARGLSGGGLGPVGILLRSITGASFTSLAQGAQHEAAERGRLCLIGTTGGDPGTEHAQLELMRGQRAAAVVLLGGARDLEEFRRDMALYATQFAAHGGRVVLCGRPPLGIDADIIEIGYDHAAATYEMGVRLAELGHRDVLVVPGAPDSSTAVTRLDGYRRALAEVAGSRVEVRWTTLFDKAEARVAVANALADGVPFTAVACGTDDMALGVLQALRAAGLRCPEDVSVTGFDGIPVTEDTTPTLTTAQVPYDTMGHLAVALALDNVGKPPPPRVVLPVPIAWRESTGPAPDLSAR